MENPTLTIDGKKLRSLREQQKLTQLFLATSIEVTTETISRWENKAYPTIKRENAEKLAEILNVPLTLLLKEPSDPADLECTAPPFNRAAAPWWAKFAGKYKRGTYALVGLALLAIITVPLFWKPSSNNTQLIASRYIPSCILPGQPFPVLVRIESEDIAHPIMLRENLPEHSQVVAALPPCMNAGHSQQQLKWMIDNGRGCSTAIAFLVQSDRQHMGQSLVFSGSIVTGRRESKQTEVQGINTTEISEYHWADENRDHRIDDYEMLSVYDLFPNGEQLGINLGEIKAIWAGEGYRWDANQGHLVILGHDQPVSRPLASETERAVPLP